LILALDVGTLSVRTAVYNQHGKLEALASRPIELQRLSEVEVEQDPLQLKNQLGEALAEILALPLVQKRGIIAAGLTTQRSSVVAWNRRTGKPLSPVLSWQDRRGANYLKPLASKQALIKRESGLFLSPHYGASKMRWLLDHCPSLQQQADLTLGPLAAFIIYHLLDEKPCIVDHVNASRTQLMDLTARDWSDTLLAQFQIDKALLPTCQPTQSFYGYLAGTEIPLTAVNGDQNAAIHGSGTLDNDTCIVNIGTGAFVLLPTGKRLIDHPRLLASIATSTATHATYLLEGTVNSAGAAIQWAAEKWSEPNLTQQLAHWLAEVTDPPIFVNTIGGLGSPLWSDAPPPYFIGDGTLAEKTVAIVESIVFLLQLNLVAMRNTGQVIKRIRISGGLSALDGLCQLLADISQRAVIRAEERQSTARGIAWLATNQGDGWPSHNEHYFLPKQNRPLHNRYRQFCAQLGWN
jgi:glycerol kinase